MCIALLSTAHPAYSLILLSNRDEFLSRPTAPSQWWEQPFSHVLAGRDLQKKEKGTWLGITSDGRLAVLTNFRDEGVEITKDKSRGAIVTAWLKPSAEESKNVDDFAHEMIEEKGIHDVGGFSLIYGRLRKERGKGLAIISNRTKSAGGLIRIAKDAGETHGLSNSHYGDMTWPKVVHGEMLLSQAISSNISRGDQEDTFIESLFDILAVDTLPKKKPDESDIAYMRQLRNSIFIPPIGGEIVEASSSDALHKADSPEAVTGKEGIYGTQKQTVILVNTAGKVTWLERTLDSHGLSTTQPQRRFDFDINGWEA